MDLRTVRSQRRLRVELEYIRLVEDYWESGRSKRRVIANFSRNDLLAPHLERLIEPCCPWNRDSGDHLLADETVRTVLSLNRDSGIGARKIAKSTGFPLGTVSAILSRSRQQSYCLEF